MQLPKRFSLASQRSSISSISRFSVLPEERDSVWSIQGPMVMNLHRTYKLRWTGPDVQEKTVILVVDKREDEPRSLARFGRDEITGTVKIRLNESFSEGTFLSFRIGDPASLVPCAKHELKVTMPEDTSRFSD